MTVGYFLFTFPFLRKLYIYTITKYNEIKSNIPGIGTKFVVPPDSNDSDVIVLCYPEMPYIFHTINQICKLKGYTLTNKKQKANVVMFFQDDTFRKPDGYLQTLAKKQKVINYLSRDISKHAVEKAHKKVFGYGMEVNPLTYKGTYIRKGNANSFHVGKILHAPEKPKKGYVYQKLIDGEVNGVLYEIRLHIVGNTITSAYLKHRSSKDRFESNTLSATCVNPLEVISKKEYTQVLRFCREMHIDYAELDALRDAKSKKLYVIDANNTPGGPPDNLPVKDFMRALRLQTAQFEKTFVK